MIAANTWVRTSVSLLCLATVSCRHRSETNIVPRIESLSPANGSVADGSIISVLVTGSGFDSLNTVHFGRLELRQIPRISETTLRFVVPLDDSQLPDRGEAPPQALAEGPYTVTVSTSRGRSNVLTFTLQRSKR